MKTAAIAMLLGIIASSSTADADCSREVPIASAIATAQRAESGIAWDTRWIIGFDAIGDFDGGRITFAVPLPTGESMQSARGITPVIEDGHITAVCVEPSALDGRTIHAIFTQPGTAKLGAPLAAGNAVQIIDAADREDLEVQGRVLEPHVGFLAARGISHDAREEALRLTNAPPMIARTFVFVRGADLHASGGLEGKLGGRAKARSTTIGAGLAFVGVVALLVVAAGRLKKRATVERADALLAGEIEAAGRTP